MNVAIIGIGLSSAIAEALCHTQKDVMITEPTFPEPDRVYPYEIYEMMDELYEPFFLYQKTEKQFYEHKSQHKLPPFNHKPKNELKKQAYIYQKNKEC